MALETDFSQLFDKLDTLKMYAPNFAMEAMQKSGARLRSVMVGRAKSMGTHQWGKTEAGRYKRLTFGEREKQAYTREGSRVSGKNENLAEFIRFQAYDASMKVLVGWMNEKKGFKSYRYHDGKKTPFSYVSGVYVKDIGKKMEYGGRVKLTEKQKKFFRASGMAKIAQRGYVQYKARPIVIPTYNMMRRSIFGDIEKSYKEAFSRVYSLDRRVS